MAILDTVKKFGLRVKTATGYITYKLGSEFVQMDNGKDLQTAFDDLNDELNSNLQIETGSVSSVDKGAIRYVKNGNVVYVYGFLTINDSIGAVDILPYRAKRAARFPAAGYFNVDSNVASYGHGRVETDNGKVSIWLDSAATYAAINFVYETTGERTSNSIIVD